MHFGHRFTTLQVIYIGTRIDIGIGIDTGLAADAFVVCVTHSQAEAHKEKEGVNVMSMLGSVGQCRSMIFCQI